MKLKLTIALVALLFICTPTWAQTKKTSKAEKMGYSRSNNYWGPGTFYCYAPGKPINKMADNMLSHMRDLTGISREDFYTELTKQDFTALPQTKKKTWYKPTKSVKLEHFYSPDKSYILEPSFEDLYMSPVKKDGTYAYVTKNVVRYELIPIEDSLEVIEHIWQFLRDLRELDVVLGSFNSNYKKADPKAYPFQRAATAGWTGFRAGTWVLTTVDGKLKGIWGDNEEIIHRTIGMPEFRFVADGWETDFCYSLIINLTKEGYVLRYQVIAQTISNLAPGNTWKLEYPILEQVYNNGVTSDKKAVDLFKNAPFPPVLYDLNTLLHIK